jgi:hypothetical protein
VVVCDCNPSYSGGDGKFKASPGKVNEILSQKQNLKTGHNGECSITQVIEHLPSKYKEGPVFKEEEEEEKEKEKREREEEQKEGRREESK